MQDASADYLNVPFNELTDKHALQIHGYVFSDDDGSTDSEGLSDFDEQYAFLKPPPLKIDLNNVILIEPRSSNKAHQKYLQQKQRSESKIEKFSYRSEQIKSRNNFSVSVNNFYELLGQSDEDESDKDSEIKNTYVEKPDVGNRKVSKKKRRKEKRRAKNETSLESCSFMNCSDVRDRDDDENYILDLNFFLDRLPWYFWSEEILYITAHLERKIETQRTSWDKVWENHIYGSDKLLEQEYCDIVGSRKCTCCSGYEYTRHTALKNLLEVTGMPCVAYLANKCSTVLDNDMFLNVVGILIAAFIYTRCK